MPATTNKQQLLTQSLPLLKKKFAVADEPDDKRPVLEEVVYAVLREGATTPAADEAYARLLGTFFDWNEVRVSSVQEVADALAGLPDAGDKARRVVEFLQEHFERTYSFTLEDLEKKGLKQSAKQLARYKDKGVTDFVVAWVTQRTLGGHAIPLDEPTLRVLRRLAVIEGEVDDLEATRGTIEHYVPKAKGVEFTELYAEHAAAVCVDGTPDCPHCPLKADCPTGQDLLARAKAEGKLKPKSR